MDLNPCFEWCVNVRFNRSWRISKIPNTTKFFLIIFKLIQQSIRVILSCLAKKNRTLNSREKSSVYYWKGSFVDLSGLKTQLSVINWTFFSRISISIILWNDHIRLLYKFENDQKKLVVLGVFDMRQLLLTNFYCAVRLRMLFLISIRDSVLN
jgi:hypothetical protein